jgi:uncharacterized RDD family membrane protein YckC
VTTAGDASSDTQAYVRFTRRVQAVLVDTIIFMIILAAALAVAVSSASDNIARIVGFTVAATWLFYEPLLVSLTGGTIGHYLYNMRVVDDRGGNVNFLKAVARVLIKSLLGWYSFVAIAMTYRHQAVHDLLTSSTVQIRDLAKAQPHHFRGRRETISPPGMPSFVQRGAIVAAYLLSCFVLFSLAMASLGPVGLVSRQCIDGEPCSTMEFVVLTLLWVAWAGASIWAAVAGWQGRLLGARAER